MVDLDPRDVPLLAGCSAHDGRNGLAPFRRATVPAGHVLISETAAAREFFIILSGTVAVSSAGRFVRLLAGPTFVGEEAMLATGPRSATGTAMTTCEVLVTGQLGFDEILRLPGVDPEIRATIATRASGRLTA